MPVRKEVISLKVLVDFKEMEAAAGILAGSTGSRFAIAYNRAVGGDQSRLRKRPERQNHARRVATWIGHQASSSNLCRIQFRQAIDAVSERIGMRRSQFVPERERLGGTKSKCAAKINYSQTSFDQWRGKLGRDLMGSGQEDRFRAAFDDLANRKRSQRRFTESSKLRKQLRKAVPSLQIAQVKCARRQGRVANKDPRQLKTGVAGDPYNRDLLRVSHFEWERPGGRLIRSSIFL